MTTVIIFLKKNWFLLLVIFLLALPSFYNVYKGHNWGGDFSQYIHQGERIVTGQSQDIPQFVVNPYYFIAPKAYPIGFPLLLSPAIAMFGIDMVALLRYMALITFGMLICGYFYFQSTTQNRWVALILAAAIGYSSFVITFKNSVLSDLPFTFVFALLLVLYGLIKDKEPPSLNYAVGIGLLLGLAISIRTIGYAFFPAIGCYTLLRWHRYGVSPYGWPYLAWSHGVDWHRKSRNYSYSPSELTSYH